MNLLVGAGALALVMAAAALLLRWALTQEPAPTSA